MEPFRKDVTVYIDGKETTPLAVENIRIRRVSKLYSRERPVEEWTGDAIGGKHTASKRLSRYVLYLETDPRRAKRDSTYYVFSPFYSGDF